MENLYPAIQLKESPSYMSPEEFQKMLSSWLDDKGILPDLRSQLRFKMINVLRNTAIGRDIAKRTSPHTSLSKQAVSLIVAEFLMHNKYHYSLSIFNTEALLSNIFPECPPVFNTGFDTQTKETRFDRENILNIIELIGIAKNSAYLEELMSVYFTYNENLLCCLISLLGKLTNVRQNIPDDSTSECNIDLNNEDEFSRQVGKVLLQSNLDSKHVKNVIKKVKNIYEVEVNILVTEHSKLVNELKSEILCQERKTKEIHKLNKVLEKKLLKTREDYSKLKCHMKNLIIQEKRLKERQKQSNKYETVPKVDIISNNLKPVTSSLGEQIPRIPYRCQLQHCSDSCKDNAGRAERLTKDNHRLKRENEDQKEEIERLSTKCKDIVTEFTDCQSKINLLNSRVNQGKIFDNLFQEELLKAPQVHLQSNVDISDLSSGSATEEILQQARARLKILEEESRIIEEKYKKLHLDINLIPMNSVIL